MYPRLLDKKLRKAAESYPVVSLIGPRQSGKSTLIRAIFSEKPYVNLESIREAEFAKSDPIGFLRQFPHGAVLDEIQKAPNLLSEIQVIVDESVNKGMFILSGSENLTISQSLSQSLAGRVLVLKLLPLSLQEMAPFPLDVPSVDAAIYQGSYPRIYNDSLEPNEALAAYIETYVERDIRSLLNVKNLSQFRRFLELCAGRVGQILNKASLAADTGISQSTVEEWLSILEATFICFRMSPWHANIGKRLVKSPKLYFYDVGLASHLLGLLQMSHVRAHPLRGQLFENLQLTEIKKFLVHRNLKNKVYFYRDSHGHEVDVLIQDGNKLHPIEIKSSETFHPSLLSGLRKLQMLKLDLYPPAIILGHDVSQHRSDFDIVGWQNTESYLQQILVTHHQT